MRSLLKRLYFRITRSKLILEKKVNVSISSYFEGRNRICSNTTFRGKIGLGSYIGPFSQINAEIGRYTSIAENVKVITSTHPLSDFVTTCPMFYSLYRQNGYTYTKKQLFDEYKYIDKQNKVGVIIGNDVWIGANTVIIGGTIISDGAVVLANAVVTKDVPPYAIVGGVPAKIIKYRFNREQIDFLLRFKWWEKNENWLENAVEDFSNINLFISKYNKI